VPVTIDDAVGRLLRSHWFILLTVTLLPVILLLAFFRSEPVYVASVRLQLAGGPATSNIEADSMSTRVTALATTPRFVTQALDESSADRDTTVFAMENISVQRQGQSSVVELAVTDREPTVASAVAGSLATQVVSFMNSSDHTAVPTILEDLNQRRRDLLEQRTKLTEDLAATPDDRRQPIWEAQLTVVEQALADIAAERSRILLQDATQPRAVIVDGTSAARLMPSQLPQEAGLALVFGVLLALLAVSLLELLRPTVPSARALSRLLQVPVLARARPPLDRPEELDQLLMVVDRAARRHGKETVVLAGARPHQQAMADELVERLCRLRNLDPNAAGGAVRWRTADIVSAAEEDTCGVVLLAPGSVKRRSLEGLEDLQAATGWPLIGIVQVPSRRTWRSRRPRPDETDKPTAAATGAPDGATGEKTATVRCTTVGLRVDVSAGLPWVAAMVDEGNAGDDSRADDPTDGDVRVVVERHSAPFDVTDWHVVTRGVHANDGRVVMQDACSTGFSLLFEPSGTELEVRARWCPSPRARLAASLLPSRFHLLVRCALLQYPALWWSGVAGRVPMHASALRLGDPYGDVVALLAGPGGVGKSTLLSTEIRAGGVATCDNICVVDPTSGGGGVVASGLLEPLRIEGAEGRRMPHGRREQTWSARATELTATRLVVVRRGRQAEPVVRAVSEEEAARALVGGTYAAGELRRYWPFAASLALGTGLGPVHPPVPEAARQVAALLPCSELVLPSRRGTRLGEVLQTERTGR
jgi:capsular polysaccharide biosynthesis protein